MRLSAARQASDGDAAASSAQSTLVQAELAARHAAQSARAEQLEARERALLAAVADEEREWVAQQRRLDSELDRQHASERAVERVVGDAAAAEARKKLVLLGAFVVGALFVFLTTGH